MPAPPVGARSPRLHRGGLVTPNEANRQRLVETRVRFKRLSRDEIESLPGVRRMARKGGRIRAQGIAGAFIARSSAPTAVVGLPLDEVTTLLAGEGYPIRSGWLNAV